eukprot:TRINITY_DN6565_c0_g1_i7.p1 TRINITY_DN6565_c0_g1~~TRINITY_DN6565_c0_g1_i7.p1  ORF type:complete len:149 (+),score=22.75 TRINITY_DN6565_c0_g1_i7:135-581(+)
MLVWMAQFCLSFTRLQALAPYSSAQKVDATVTQKTSWVIARRSSVWPSWSRTTILRLHNREVVLNLHDVITADGGLFELYEAEQHSGKFRMFASTHIQLLVTGQRHQCGWQVLESVAVEVEHFEVSAVAAFGTAERPQWLKSNSFQAV